jgi:hypothetical protein
MRNDRQFIYIDSRPRESKAQRIIRYNFWFSAVLLVGMIVWSYAVLARTGKQVAPMEVLGTSYVGGSTNSGGWIYILIEAVAAVLFFRKGGSEARGVAIFVGLYLLAGLAVVVGSVDPGESANTFVVLTILYASGSHLLYGIAGSRERLI